LKIAAALAAALSFAAGCGGGGAGAPGGGTGGVGGGSATGAVTYYKDVLPILNQHCVSCHAPGGIAPFAFTSYDDTHGYAGLMAANTQSGTMPPWMPAPGCGDFRDVRRLAAADVATIQSWNAAGAPAGNPADAPAPARPSGPDLGTPNATLDPGMDYQPNAALTDDYHCSLIDPGLTAAQYLIGFDVHPGTPSSVHHVLLFAVPANKVAAVQAKDAAEPGAGWTCFAGSGVDGTPVIGGWVPGSGAASFPPPTGILLPAGTQVVMQIHYNLLTQKQVSDRTTAGLYYSAQPVAKPATVYAILNDTFLVPAGTKSQTVTADLPLAASYALWGVVPHMHLHGTEIKMSILHADGSSTCAVDIPAWNFHWQQFYYYQQPMIAQAGDTVHLECTFDNSAANQPVINGVQQAPADLQWGEKTTDEMCLNYLYFTLP
jgi:hypothetical protein